MPTAVSFNLQSSKESSIPPSSTHKMGEYFQTPSGLAVKLKRKWDLSEEEGEANSDSSSKSKLSHKKLKRTQSQLALNSPNTTTALIKSPLKVQSFSAPNSSPSSDDDMLSSPQNHSNTNSKSDASKDEDEFHKSMFQAYVNSAIENLDKVCFVVRFVCLFYFFGGRVWQNIYFINVRDEKERKKPNKLLLISFL